MIHELDGKYSISSRQVWVPGCYDTKRAARYAFRFSNAELEALQKRKNEENGGTCGVITFEDLKALK